MCFLLSVIRWDYSKILYSSDKWHVNISWYGVCFAVGVLMAYAFGLRLASNVYEESKNYCCTKARFLEILENYGLYSLLFIIPGARIAYVLFYGGKFYFDHPWEIIKIWHGGLSSHGGIAGLLLWTIIFSYAYAKRIPILTFFFLTDLCASVFGYTAFLIRIGNFINQEIVGTPTSLPWGIIFSNPMQGIIGVPVHPVQLYEGVAYFILSTVLYVLSYNCIFRLGSGFATSIACMGVAIIRFFAEFLKTHQGNVVSEFSFLTIGQLLSIPLFLFGLCLGIFCLLFNRNRCS
ncbi:prolipoprotein diacylglyceryl transferase [Chlamydia ibidis]|uniref:Phosphatidylglycerol--prolipoprotein diacylglyceryl transferase n=2 Tax=Chlamydia ibidis TaxID=1405396 RepID=S7J5B2_9CHLA|nr:prolipoprotein diacylglyceryl transferase [Chlamydia ibidis]EPP35604.1 prolipoprotein diacylglyceryl transferase [Chlamydia ibidis]EQM62526.1 prolipoprotein diacylglyceryl transferase [Chlamydia ibidis 10-1398/6]